MKQLALALALIFVVACKQSTKAPPPEPSRSDACTSALAPFHKYIDVGDDNPAARAKVKTAILDRCMSDHWSDAALACMRAAGTSHDTFKCWNDLLTKEQVEAVRLALGDLKLTPPVTPP